mmetsp:Transcript_66916/g.116464  ORF Transcript_66916/g.116464 Transcript_66916/m.116464 type:complete len:97 (+) Transcript_66916:26-316(+)
MTDTRTWSMEARDLHQVLTHIVFVTKQCTYSVQNQQEIAQDMNDVKVGILFCNIALASFRPFASLTLSHDVIFALSWFSGSHVRVLAKVETSEKKA